MPAPSLSLEDDMESMPWLVQWSKEDERPMAELPHCPAVWQSPANAHQPTHARTVTSDYILVVVCYTAIASPPLDCPNRADPYQSDEIGAAPSEAGCRP